MSRPGTKEGPRPPSSPPARVPGLLPLGPPRPSSPQRPPPRRGREPSGESRTPAQLTLHLHSLTGTARVRGSTPARLTFPRNARERLRQKPGRIWCSQRAAADAGPSRNLIRARQGRRPCSFLLPPPSLPLSLSSSRSSSASASPPSARRAERGGPGRRRVPARHRPLRLHGAARGRALPSGAASGARGPPRRRPPRTWQALQPMPFLFRGPRQRWATSVCELFV